MKWAVLALAALGCGAPARTVEHGGELVLEGLLPFDPSQAKPGGAATVEVRDLDALEAPVRSLSLGNRSAFFLGEAAFEIPWVIAPSPRADQDGLGPMFHADSCRACHVHNAKGDAEDKGRAAVPLLLRLSSGEGANGPTGVPGYGTQLQPLALPGVAAEGIVRLKSRLHPGVRGDGTLFELQSWDVTVAWGRGAPTGTVQQSLRATSTLAGLGLLEAVSEATILEWDDPDDEDGDGISGRPNRAPDGRLGRFGWKASQPSLDGQAAAAFSGDLGLTSHLEPLTPCEPDAADCLGRPNGGDPEVDDATLEAAVTYTRLLGVLPRPEAADRGVREGEREFHRVGCDACHRPTMTTAAQAKFVELQGQQLWPYTDLLLHDMGEGLADGRGDLLASGREWRTPPLWGLGVATEASEFPALLHDGRARSLEEAVLWHGGEAQASRDAYLQLKPEWRGALLRFVASL